MTATEIARRLPITRQAVAKHLGVLEGAGLVERQRAGREMRYLVEPRALKPAGAWIDHVTRQWEDRLARLKTYLEREGL